MKRLRIYIYIVYILKTSSCFVSLDSSSKHLSRLFSNRAENSGNPVRDEINPPPNIVQFSSRIKYAAISSQGEKEKKEKEKKKKKKKKIAHFAMTG
ncbi:hypothetical protein HZU73_07723 [Apis mellifera caucasica]|nr:hypothetical protein HZU73_07723 [Apis mellifera caucasica]